MHNQQMQEIEEFIELELYDPKLQDVYDALYSHLVEEAAEAIKFAKALPEYIIKILGEELKQSHAPLNTITGILNRFGEFNILDSFLAISMIMYRELKDSDYYLKQTMRRTEFFLNDISEAIIKMNKE